MSRLKRKNRKDIEFKNAGGLLDLFDNQIKATFRIDDKEFDYLAEVMSDEEISLFINENPTFTEKRQLLIMIEKYLNERL